MEKQIEINKGKKVIVREITWAETYAKETGTKIQEIGYAPTMLALATDLTQEEILGLSKKDGTKLWKVYVELNEEQEDFQTLQVKETDK